MWWLFGLLLVGMTSCSFNHRGQEVQRWMQKTDDVPRVLCTTFMIDDMVKMIGGDVVFSLSLIPSIADPHSYEMVKGDGEKFSQADLIFSGGLGLEHGATISKQLKQHARVVCVGDILRAQFPEKIYFIQDVPDPHIWLDLHLWAQAVDVVEGALQALFPNSSQAQEQIRRGALNTKRLFLQKHYKMKDELSRISPEKRFLVTSHNAFNYFSQAYLQQGIGLESRTSAPEGISPDAQISARDIERVVHFIINNHVEVIFPEFGMSRDSLYKIQELCVGSGHPVRVSSESLCSDSIGDSTGYLEMMEKNAEILAQEWQ